MAIDFYMIWYEEYKLQKKKKKSKQTTNHNNYTQSVIIKYTLMPYNIKWKYFLNKYLLNSMTKIATHNIQFQFMFKTLRRLSIYFIFNIIYLRNITIITF